MRLLLVVLLSLSAGCAHAQLRKYTVNQVRTVSDLQTQQVLDNLAMFVANPESMPFFSVPGAGGTSLNTSAEAGNSISWNLLGFASDTLSLRASRTKAGSWTLAPINDPAKLERMRCAYQIAVGHYPINGTLPCSACCKLLERWYPDATGNCGVPCRVPPPGWYAIGCEKDVPKDACHVGHYCNTWVWVSPYGREELTRLTLTILDFATAASGYVGPPIAPTPTQQVVRKWVPIYELDKTLKQEVVTGYKLLEVTTTTIEPQGLKGVPGVKDAPGVPEGGPTDRSNYMALPAPATAERELPQFDRPRDNFFNPILPQLQLFNNP